MRTPLALFAGAAVLALASAAAAETVAVTNAHIYSMGPAGEIASGTVLIRDGKVAAVGASVSIPSDARRIDAHGQAVTPGFMMAGTAITIVDLPSYGTLDDTSTDNATVSAGYDVQYSINPDVPDVSDARAQGLTAAIVTPDPGRRHDAALFFGGQAALVKMSASRDLLAKAQVGVTMEGGAGGAGLVGGGRGVEIVLLKSVLDDARRYAADRKAYDEARMRQLGLSAIDLEALVPVVQGKTPLIVSVERASDISVLLKVAAEQKIRLVLLGAAEGWVVAKDIAAAGVPVIVNPETNIPEGLNDLGSTYENAARLQAAGVTIAFQAVHARPGDLVRSPRVIVGRLVGQGGLPFAAALAGLTTGPARIAGVADHLGSLAPGMTADLVVWSGDPLETTTYPQAVFIDGAEQPLTTREELLGEKYLKQYRAAGIIPPAAR